MSAENPLVPRPVRTGGLLLAVGAAQFVAVLLWVQNLYPGFNAGTTTVTALRGAPAPWGLVFDASIVAFGALGLFGLLLSWSAFDARPSRGLGLLVLVASAVGVLATGATFLLRSRLPAFAPGIAADVAVIAAGIGMLIVSSAMHQHGRWRVSRAYTFASGLAVLAAGALAAAPLTLPIGVGGLERIVVGAALLWALIEGVHLAVLHRFAPGLTVRVASA